MTLVSVDAIKAICPECSCPVILQATRFSFTCPTCKKTFENVSYDLPEARNSDPGYSIGLTIPGDEVLKAADALKSRDGICCQTPSVRFSGGRAFSELQCYVQEQKGLCETLSGKTIRGCKHCESLSDEDRARLQTWLDTPNEDIY